MTKEQTVQIKEVISNLTDARMILQEIFDIKQKEYDELSEEAQEKAAGLRLQEEVEALEEAINNIENVEDDLTSSI